MRCMEQEKMVHLLLDFEVGGASQQSTPLPTNTAYEFIEI